MGENEKEKKKSNYAFLFFYIWLEQKKRRDWKHGGVESKDIGKN